MPMFHIFGIKDGLTISMLLNNRLILPSDNRTNTIISVLEKEKCTLFHSVPTMMLAIVNNKNFSSEKLAHVRVTELAGAALAEPQMRMLIEKLPNDHFTCAYGLSEIAPVSITVYVNTSTRFTDGGEFGLGCEMGISTQKFHARCPMGLEELTSYKYVIRGNGQIR